MGRIRLLDSNIAAQIAAGEVIERPVSVVKELLENALDANAKHITIDIEDGGLALIRVSDDGQGMAKDDLPMAFQRHATSKISVFNDLFNLASFGFRGEALASMAAISQVSAVSGQSTTEPAWQYDVNGGETGNVKPAPPLQGTIIEIRNLFYNVPARRKFMKSNTQENGRIRHMVAMMALARPDVTFKLTLQRELVFHTTNLDTTEARMALVYGESCHGHILTVPKTEIHPNHFVEAWLSDATITRANRQDINCFVNDRYVHSKALQQMVETAYYSFIPAERFPLVVIKLTVPPETVDVNVHPAKTTVQLVQPERWRDTLVDLLKDTLWHSAIATRLPHTDPGMWQNEKTSLAPPKGEKRPLIVSEAPATVAPETPTPISVAKRTGGTKQSLFQSSPMAMPKAPDHDDRITRHTPSRPAKETEVPASGLQVKDLSNLLLIGQLHNTFILAQNEQGLYIIDQHTCHERILYERYQKALAKEDIVMQAFLLPVPIRLSPLQDSILLAHIVRLRDLGFVFEHQQPGVVQLMQLPAVLDNITDYQGMVEDILDRMQSANRLELTALREAVITGAACKGAVKANAKLSPSEMTRLLSELADTDNAHTCPHGRPIVMALTMTELYRYFKRGSYEVKS